jgi:hypothetical protein
MSSRVRNYWVYSAGLAVAWLLVLLLTALIGGGARVRTVGLLFLGFALGWVSTTIARSVYPPPAKWTAAPADAAVADGTPEEAGETGLDDEWTDEQWDAIEADPDWKKDGAPAPADAPLPGDGVEPAAADYVGTYRWTDTHGVLGTVDILASASAEPVVVARTTGEDPVTVVTVDSRGHADWSRDQLAAIGLDSAAARNNLIELCQEAYERVTHGE